MINKYVTREEFEYYLNKRLSYLVEEKVKILLQENKQPIVDKWVSTKDFIKVLGITRQTLNNWLKKESIYSLLKHYIRKGKRNFYNVTQITNLMERHPYHFGKYTKKQL